MLLVIGAAAAWGPWNHAPAWAYSVDAIYAIVNNATYGNSAIKTEANSIRLLISGVQQDLDNGTNGLTVIRGWAQNSYSVLTSGTSGLIAIKGAVNDAVSNTNTIDTYLKSSIYGLPKVLTEVGKAVTNSSDAKTLLNSSVNGLSVIRSRTDDIYTASTGMVTTLGVINTNVQDVLARRTDVTDAKNALQPLLISGGTSVADWASGAYSRAGVATTAAQEARTAAQQARDSSTSVQTAVTALGNDMAALASSQSETNGLLERVAGPECDPTVVPWASLGAQCLPGRVEIKNQHDSLISKIQELITGQGLLKPAIDAVKAAIELVQSKIDAAKTQAQNDATARRNQAQSHHDALKGAVDLVKGAVDGVKSAIDLVRGKLDEMKTQAANDAAERRNQAQQQHEEMMEKLEDLAEPKPPSTYPAICSNNTSAELRNTHPNPAGVAALGWGNWPGTGTVTSAAGSGSTPNGSNTFRRVTWTTGTTTRSGGAILRRTNAGLPAGVAVPVSVYVRSSVQQVISPQIQKYTGTSASGSSWAAANITLQPGVWTRYETVIPLTAAEDSYELRFYAAGAGVNWPSGSTLDLTEALETATGPWFGGGYSPYPDREGAWAGAVNGSATVLRPVQLTSPADWVRIGVSCALGGEPGGGVPEAIEGGGPGTSGWADPVAKVQPMMDMWGDIVAAFDVPPSGQCLGPAMALPEQMGGTIYPLSACDEPMRSIAGWSKILGSVLLILGALFNIVRTQSAAWGLQVDIGKGD